MYRFWYNLDNQICKKEILEEVKVPEDRQGKIFNGYNTHLWIERSSLQVLSDAFGCTEIQGMV